MPFRSALHNARFGIGTVALTYALSVSAGALMVHSGQRSALNYRDNMVNTAQRESLTLRQFNNRKPLAAAALDAAANATAGLMSLIAGYGVPAGYAVDAWRGWIGGIVSVDGEHRSRLAHRDTAFYYLITLLLQLIPYSLTGGAGINLGIAAFASETRTGYTGPRLPGLRIPYQAIRDAAWIYLFSLPLFAIASLFEFLN